MADTMFNLATKGKFEIDPVAIANFLRSPEGPVLRKFIEVGEAVKVETIRSLKDGFPRDFLGPSVVKRITTSSNGPRVLVGSDRTKTQAHPIEGNPVLVFDFPKAGGTVFLRHVNHPGSDFTTYLLEKLAEAIEKVIVL